MQVLISSKCKKQVQDCCLHPENLILFGDRGLGKRLIAEQIAAAWLGCSVEQLFLHPDFGLIEPDGSGIKKGQIDEMAEVFALRPSAAGKRVILMDDASSMNYQGMNALLKPLEDYGSWLCFILVAHAPLICTIRSRCREVCITAPGEEELRDYLGDKVDPVCLCAAGGKIGDYTILSKRKSFLQEMGRFLTALNTMREKKELLSVTGALKEKDPGYYPERFKEELDGFFQMVRELFFRHLCALSEGDPAREHLLTAGGKISEYTLQETVCILQEISNCRRLREQKKFSKNDFFRLVSIMAGRRMVEVKNDR